MGQMSRLRDAGIPPLVAGFAVAGLVVVGLALASYVLGLDFAMLKVGNEGNLPTWYSSVQLFTIGLVLTALAYRDVASTSPRALALVSVPSLFFFLSLDEFATIHEQLGIWLQEHGIGAGMQTGPWMFIYVPLVAVWGAVALWSLMTYLTARRDVVVLGTLGVAVFGGAAVGLEYIANFFTGHHVIVQGLSFAEEYGEMLAATLLLWASVRLVRYEGIRLLLTTAPVGDSPHNSIAAK